jgi:uncharacterized membrane protein
VSAVAPSEAPPAARRLVGVDVARGVALLAMMAVHVVPATTAGQVHPLHQAFGGRASALFAVLAGVSLALVAGREVPPRGADHAAAARGLLARAGVVAVVGLTLGTVSTTIAVILVNYAALFVVASAFLGLRARVLWPLAAGWLLLSPVLGHLLRAQLPAGPGAVPSWLGLADPAAFATELEVTGYYPVLTWTGYLLLGLAAGRSAWLHRGGPARVAAAGAAALLVALAVRALSAAVLAVPEVRERLVVPPGSPLPASLDLALQTSMYGTTPTTSWWWLVVAAPHSGTPVDLVHTAGCAVAVLCAALLLARVPGPRLLLVPLAAAGSMTLTLYSVHVVVEAVRYATAADPSAGAELVWALQAVAAMLLATTWRLVAGRAGVAPRGPLESLAAQASHAASGPRPSG